MVPNITIVKKSVWILLELGKKWLSGKRLPSPFIRTQCFAKELKVTSVKHCAVPENIHTPPTEGIGISWGVEVLENQKN